MFTSLAVLLLASIATSQSLGKLLRINQVAPQYQVTSLKCSGKPTALSAATILLLKSKFKNFDARTFPSSCNIACTSNVSYAFQDSGLVLTFKPKAALPAGCSCYNQVTIANFTPSTQTTYVSVNKKNTFTLTQNNSYTYTLVESFDNGAMVCTLQASQVNADGTLYAPLPYPTPNVALPTGKLYLSPISQCQGAFEKLTFTNRSKLGKLFGVTRSSGSFVNCYKSCLAVAKVALDTKMHKLNFIFASSKVPSGCKCTTAKLSLSQYNTTFYDVFPEVGFMVAGVGQNAVYLYKSVGAGKLNCTWFFSNDTSNQLYFPKPYKPNFPPIPSLGRLQLEFASCVGNFTALNSTVVSTLKASGGFVPSDYPSNCNKACISLLNYSYNNKTPSTVISLTKIPSLPSGCKCLTNGLQIQAVQMAKSTLFAGFVPKFGQFYAYVQNSSLAIIESIAGGTVNCTFSYKKL